ncbi:MAG: aminopeptidase N [Pseudomonadota bacterium]|nr:aminopeptidase N [Pseudomonadota bacterium]
MTIPAAAPKTIHRRDYTPPAWLVEAVELRFDLREGETLVEAALQVRRNPARATENLPLVLDGEQLELLDIAINGTALNKGDYAVDDRSLTLQKPPADTFTLKTRVRIHPEKNTALEGLYMSRGRFVTQCEAEGFRRITYFIDRPDVMARYTTTIEADKANFPLLLSNGNPVAQGEAANGRHWAKWEDPFPKPCYLFALVAGAFDVLEDTFTIVSKRKVTLRIYSEPGNRDKCHHALESLKKSMAWDEKTFGLEYDLDLFMIVAVDDFNAGAMENKGLNIFNSKAILARPDTATDADYIYIEAVVGHEYFHNWTGDRITCRDWFQLTLKEGLTVYREQEFSCDMNSRAVMRIFDIKRLRSMQFREDAGPMAHPIRPDSYMAIENFYTMTVYEKGAEVIRMIETLVGREGFRKGMDLYFKRHDGQAVTCDDFVAAMTDANDRAINKDQFLLWYSQAGTPVIEASGVYDAQARTYALTLRQSCPPTPGQPVKEPVIIPVAIGLVGPDGKDIPLHVGEHDLKTITTVCPLVTVEETIVFEKVAAKPVPSLLRNLSAPVILKMDLTDDELAFLMASDSDLFNRWNAGQTLAMNVLKGLISVIPAQTGIQTGSAKKLDSRFRGNDSLNVPEIFLNAFRKILSDKTLDPDFASHALALPPEGDIAQEMPVVHVDAIHAAREFVHRELATQLRPLFLERYRELHSSETGEIGGAAAGRRALKNLCLDTLMAAPDAEVLSLAVAQFDTARTMTDSMAALRVLADTEGPECDRALATFEKRWLNEPLVMDKWLSVQALSQRADTLARVKALRDHPAFTMKNPNKVRALLGAFAGNPVRFHDTGGEGYDLLADTILQLDKLNPKIAANLCKSAFSTWARHEPVRRGLMKSRLERLKSTGTLSTELFEVVEKSLGA